MNKIANALSISGLLGAAFLGVGCIGDPALDGADAWVEPEGSLREGSVPESAWEPAPAGCEGVDPTGLRLVVCEGEPSLGALVDPEGAVRCVDALALLQAELPRVQVLAPASADPSPQPSMDAHDAMRRATDDVGGARAALLAGVGRADPTPTPITREDPTPTPMGQADPTPTPMSRP